MKYKCLVLDHDDTVVMSTPEIHYPSFVEGLKALRPNMEPLSLDEFVTYCFEPGFSELCRDIMKFNDVEQEYQYKIWKKFVTENLPDFYPGFPDLIKDYKKAGGIICVVSHSESQQIIRDYDLHCGLRPDLIFGWELEEDKRKPNPYPLMEIMKAFNLDKADLLVLDDLKPGLTMARSCNVDFAAAGWSHRVPQIENYMRANSDYYFSSVDEFQKFLWD